jgi:hypothetical protein
MVPNGGMSVTNRILITRRVDGSRGQRSWLGSR